MVVLSSLGLTSCATGQTALIDSYVICPSAKDFELRTDTIFQLFVDAPVIEPLPKGSDSVYAAGLIKSHRNQTIKHNNRKNKNIEVAKNEIIFLVNSQNKTNKEIREECDRLREESLKQKENKKTLGIF